MFRRVRGVLSVVSGYSGGDMENPYYEAVSEGTTGHAESIQIEFDPAVVSYKTLLEYFLQHMIPRRLTDKEMIWEHNIAL